MIVEKTPWEELDVVLDLSKLLGTGNNIQTIAEVVSENKRTKASSTATLIATVPAPAIYQNTKVITRIKSGTDKENHMVMVRANSTTGEKVEGSFQIKIRKKRR